MSNTLLVPGQEPHTTVPVQPRLSKALVPPKLVINKKEEGKRASKSPKAKNRRSCMPKQDCFSSKAQEQMARLKEDHKNLDRAFGKNIDKKMDYFYTPYRVDFVKDEEKFMKFGDFENKNKTLDWSSITKFILNQQKKPFKRALDHLNKIKSNRFDRKFHEGTNNIFFNTLFKANKRKIVIAKSKIKEQSPNSKSPKAANEK